MKKESIDKIGSNGRHVEIDKTNFNKRQKPNKRKAFPRPGTTYKVLWSVLHRFYKTLLLLLV